MRRLAWLLPVISASAGLAREAHADAFRVITAVPGPVDINQYGILGFIQNGYLLALGAASILAVASIVYGAVEYTASRGNPGKLADAWDRIVQALIGLLLLVGAATLLGIINPGLNYLELPRIRDSKVESGFVPQEIKDIRAVFSEEEIKELDETEPNWRRSKGSGQCKVDSQNKTLCGVDNMSRCTAWNAKEASAICNVESRGDPAVPSGSDRCTLPDGSPSVGFSMGLMQINLLAHHDKIPQACKGLFVGPSGRANDHSLGRCVQKNRAGVCIQWSCKFIGTKDGMEACKSAFRANNGKIAIELGCRIYQAQSANKKWQPWPHTSRVVCRHGDYKSHPERYP